MPEAGARGRVCGLRVSDRGAARSLARDTEPRSPGITVHLRGQQEPNGLLPVAAQEGTADVGCRHRHGAKPLHPKVVDKAALPQLQHGLFDHGAGRLQLPAVRSPFLEPTPGPTARQIVRRRLWPPRAVENGRGAGPAAPNNQLEPVALQHPQAELLRGMAVHTIRRHMPASTPHTSPPVSATEPSDPDRLRRSVRYPKLPRRTLCNRWFRPAKRSGAIWNAVTRWTVMARLSLVPAYANAFGVVLDRPSPRPGASPTVTVRLSRATGTLERPALDPGDPPKEAC